MISDDGYVFTPFPPHATEKSVAWGGEARCGA